MNTYIQKANDIEELAQFLSDLNNIKSSHIGYCGKSSGEIYQTLQDDFLEKNGELAFMIARNEANEIIAAIGVDIDEQTAEVWGPFNKMESDSMVTQLWEQLRKAYPNIRTFYFFINQENTSQLAFAESLQARKTGEHLILEIQKASARSVSSKRSVRYSEADFAAFESLHSHMFPNTYYDAKTIDSRLSEENVLKVLKTEDGQVQGYAYYEIDKECAEASLEYIAIAPTFQNKGLGTLLLIEIIDEIFSYPRITEIKLSVSNTNRSANHIYFKAGFEQQDILVSYVLSSASLS
ncbi:GNAT family N-acetyltransferase [Virgibacillus dakarensis]|uniref:N-acetyltransferase n=1 Tax=Lentibacillus populi TaxID=1827502 RepID=A0A9W5U273_9BACI|nr:MULTISPECIES: GNAT family N-acetyltransferase [Bacillaceae]MBT2217374.1 GNAT family N-acetyltransferase [Virgibacillus dakarensis]MTW87391.1 GNAT family N-acetyltransferase [Virgibacillus dakarensis]GGB60365.1 N-acetyltransferase [Lentibacillus populi]